MEKNTDTTPLVNFELNKQNKQNPDKHYYEAQTTGPPPQYDIPILGGLRLWQNSNTSTKSL